MAADVEAVSADRRHPLGRMFSRFRRQPAPRAAPSVPDGVRIYAIGDLHGRLDLLKRMQDRIAADLERSRPAFAAEIFLGDYVDRGPRSAEVVESLIRSPSPCDRRICLKGNHEEMLLSVLADPDHLGAWFDYGGRETLLSYGASPPPLSFAEHLLKAQESFRAAFPESHRRFLESLPHKSEAGGYLFVHAGIDPNRTIADQRSEDLLWIREPFLSNEGPFERFIVHGHTPTEQPEILSNRANIDTGAFITGKLTCLVLEGTQRRIIQATHG